MHAAFGAFWRERKAVASLEFALNGLALMLFFFALLNLGDLGLVVGTMKRGAQYAARNAAVQTGAAMATTQNTGNCATGAQILALFNHIATPILPPASNAANNGAPVVLAAWSNNTGNNIGGTTITVTATYSWTPLGMPNELGSGVPLSISSTQMVNGTSGITTSCS